jgi:hypothetical protein
MQTRKIEQVKQLYVEKGMIGGDGFRSESLAYADMMKRLEDQLNENLKRFYTVHSLIPMQDGRGIIIGISAILHRYMMVGKDENNREMLYVA